MKSFVRNYPNASRLMRSELVRGRRRRGFALIVALTLMAFIFLLLLSLTAMTQVETQTSATDRHMREARQVALLGLNLALGELQKYAGPDQRVTALAQIDETLVGSTTANGHWLGVYGNAAPTGYGATPSALAESIRSNSNSKGSQAVLLNWLVSGNENATFYPDTHVGDDGHIVTPPSGWAFTPQSAVNLEQVNTLPLSNDTQTLLVGKNSVNTASDYVSAPLVSILGSNETGLQGRYAWWVGDEGSKANVALPMANENQLATAFVSSQRHAIELVNATPGDNFSPANLIDANYNPSSVHLTGLINLSDLSMAAAQSATTMREAVKNRFHDLTAASQSILSDTYAGGLKQDLSALLATGAIAPADSEMLFTPESNATGDTFAIPTWGAMRTFAQTTSDATAMSPRLPSRTDAGFAPVMSYLSLGLQYTAPQGAAVGSPIRLAMFPMVVLWNPYTTPIAAHEYEIGIMVRNRGKYQLQVEDGVDGDGKPKWRVKETVDFNRGAKHPSDGKPESYVRFRVQCPEIPPGQSLIFTLQDDQVGKNYDADDNGKPNNTLTNGLNAYGHVLISFGADTAVFTPDDFETDEEDNLIQKNFRVTGAHLQNYTDGFSMSGGELNAYLGEVTEKANHSFTTSATNDKQWYQTIARISPAQDGAHNLADVDLSGSKSKRNELLQSVAQLGPVTAPTSAIYIKRNFGKSIASNIYPDVRWIAQSNPRALYTMRTVSKNPTNISAGGGMDSIADNFTRDTNGERASAGPSLDSGTSIVDASLFEFRPASQPLLSIGQLQHANLSYVNTYPAYPIGNSLGDFHFLNNRDKLRIAVSETAAPSNEMRSYYDLSWLLNHALWDRYFISTVPHAGTGTATDTGETEIPFSLPNPRLRRSQLAGDTQLRSADQAAAVLTLAGGFNINSTSEQAWRAVLGGINQLPYNPENQSSSESTQAAALPRFSKPISPPPVDNDHAWAWHGYRQLSDEQIAQLASNIVTEIRARGPFVSLADFVNRRLSDNPATASDERFKGVLQAAIDATATSSAAANNGADSAYGASGTNPFYTDAAPNYSSQSGAYDPELMQGYPGGFSSNAPTGSASAFAPQFLTQADILSAIGAGLTARSDTFRIRAYGEVGTPANGTVLARAWCEAIVQRQVDYLDDDGNNPSDRFSALNATNRKFGRKFTIISFRWLSPDEI